LAVGKLQAVYDQTYAIEQKVEQKDVSDLSNLEQAERTRATVEVKKLVAQLPPEFEALWTDLTAVEDSHSDYKRFYRSVFDDLDLIYSQLSRLTAYLEELVTIKNRLKKIFKYDQTDFCLNKAPLFRTSRGSMVAINR